MRLAALFLRGDGFRAARVSAMLPGAPAHVEPRAGLAGTLAASEDGAVRVAVTGRVADAATLRRRLESAGHRFGGPGEAEVLAHGYEQWGARGLAERLEGDASFVIWDGARRHVFLVPDRTGRRPLYWLHRAAGLAVATGVREVARSGLALPELEDETVWGHLLLGFPPDGRTPLAGVRRAEPGRVLEWRAEGGVLREEPLAAAAAASLPDPDEAATTLRRLARESVARALEGGGRAAVSVRGGPAARALIAWARPSLVLRWGAGGEPDEPLERAGLGTVAVRLGPGELAATLERALASGAEPAADPETLVAAALARAAAGACDWWLASEGADESFLPGPTGGGPAASRERRDRAGRVRQALEARVGGGFPAPLAPEGGSPWTVSPEFVWSIVELDRRPSIETFRRVVLPLAEPARRRRPLVGAARARDAAAAHGLDARFPWLDAALVAAAAALPEELRARAWTAALGGPASAPADAPLPLAEWLRGPLRSWLHERLDGSSLVREGLLTRRGLHAALHAHLELGEDLGRLLLALVGLDLWWRGVKEEMVPLFISAAEMKSGTISPAPVDILIPIHEGLGLARDCIRSLRLWTKHPFRALLLDDGSSAATHERLRALVADDPRFEVHRNERNFGFLGTCNRGMALARAEWVVLLNSDTVVAPGWLERMLDCARSDPRIAIVNPITNEAVNLSVRLAPGLHLLTMADRVAALSERRYPDVTTAVGMCLLIRRSTLELLGRFDPIFGNAYAEESDLCMRCTEAGLRVVAADDAFIYHKGSGSYGEERRSLAVDRNLRIFHERWGAAYERDWAAIARHDPLQGLRNRLYRGCVRQAEAWTDALETTGRRHRRLETVEALSAVADGARPAAAAALLPDRAPAATRERGLELAVASEADPPMVFDRRAPLVPTRAYVRALPRCDPDRLRVTILSAWLKLAGGVIQYVQLARELIFRGHEVKLVTTTPDCVPEQLNLFAQPLIYRDTGHLVDAFPESDVVVATFWATAHWWFEALRRRHDFLGVYYVQDYEAWFYPESERETRRDVVRSYGLADRRIVTSRWLQDLVARHGHDSEIVPLGVDEAVFYPRGNRRPGRLRVLSVAAPRPCDARRGFPDTVETFRRIHAARPDVELVLYGAPPDQMPPLPFPYVNAGRLHDPHQVAELMSSADVLLDASLWQAFGRPGLEAMACGTVPVLTNEGGLHEYAEGGANSLLVPPSDPAAAAAAMLRLLDDRALRERLAAEGVRTAARFTIGAEVDRHEALLRRWTEEARRARR